MKENNNFPKVTIVTPTFNLIKNKREDQFKNIITIVQKQSYPNIEHLIIDGNSTDGTLALLSEYEQQGKIQVYSEPDKGVYDAFNKGLKYAKGKYIAYMGSDDVYYHKDSIKILMNAILNAKAEWGYGDTLYQTENNSLWFWKGTLKSLPFGSGPCHQSMIVSVDKMKEIGGFELDNAVADIDVMLKLFKKQYPSVYVNSVISIFRAGGWSTKEGYISLKQSFLKSFYKLYGQELNLTQEECECLYAGECFSKLSSKENIELGLKLSYPAWVDTFFSRDWCILKDPNYVSPQVFQKEQITSKYYLIGIPLIKINQRLNKTLIYLLGIRILSLKKKEGKTKYYFLGIPIFKIKSKRKVICI